MRNLLFQFTHLISFIYNCLSKLAGLYKWFYYNLYEAFWVPCQYAFFMLHLALEKHRWSRLPCGRWGKSGLHRAGCQITSGGGDSKDSATENNRLTLSDKGEKACVRDHRSFGNEGGCVNPIRRKTKYKAIRLPVVLLGGSIEIVGDGNSR